MSPVNWNEGNVAELIWTDRTTPVLSDSSASSAGRRDGKRSRYWDRGQG